MKIIIETLQHTPVADLRVEVVERKGTGHPDTICDAVMEVVSWALCREYQAAFGRILHYNVDKSLLVAGRTEPRLGGGEVLEPMRFIFGDRASSEYHGKCIDVAAVAEAAAKKWFRENLRYVDPDRHIVFQNELKKGSPELTSIFDRAEICANDTSAAVGYAPYTETENIVLAVEKHVNSAGFKKRFPEVGEDVKVMGYRCDRDLLLTLAIAFVDRHVPDSRTYFLRKEEMRQELLHFLAEKKHVLDSIDIKINTLDDPEAGESGMYLTVLGTSAESGDCGQVGRGNKVSGLISLNRPMNAEAAAGKNPVSHVGKIYSVLTHHIAHKIHAQIQGIAEVNVWLGSRIGSPLAEPALVSAQVILREGGSFENIRPGIEEVIAHELENIDRFTARLQRGEFPVC